MNLNKNEQEHDLNHNMTREQLVSQLQNMKILKQYDIRSLLHGTKMTSEIEWYSRATGNQYFAYNRRCWNWKVLLYCLIFFTISKPELSDIKSVMNIQLKKERIFNKNTICTNESCQYMFLYLYFLQMNKQPIVAKINIVNNDTLTLPKLPLPIARSI